MKIREYIQVRYTGIIPDSFIDPEKLQIQIEVDDGQVFTLPTQNSFSYINNVGASVSSGTLTYNYVVNWGDGSAPQTITTYNSANRIHTYAVGGTYVIQISGVFPCWDTGSQDSIRLLITRVISWGNTGLKKINFQNCTALLRLPDQQSKLTGVLTFQYFMYGCSSLTAIPEGTLFGCNTASDFYFVFATCTKLRTISSTIFRDCTNAYQMTYALYGCTKLESIPAELFYTCTLVKSFQYTFYNCTSITSIPATLFQYNTAASSYFGGVFYQCTSITSVPSGLFTNVRSIDFSSAFYYCTSLATIPQDLFKGQNLCTSFSQCFYQCQKLQSVPSGVFDLNVAGTNACTNMQYVFLSCGIDVSITTFTVANNLFDQLTKVSTFYGVFSNCSKLVTIPTNLFVNCPLVTTFSYAFTGTKISSIPSGLFDSCTEVTDFSSCFSSCQYLISDGIPAGLFRYCTKALYFGYSTIQPGYYYYGVFYNCTNAGFTYIPAGLFDYNVNAISFQGAFAYTKITSIPTDLFRYCTAMVNADSIFWSCTSLTSLSANTFQYNLSITTVYGCFYGCTGLTSIDADLFNTHGSATNAIVDFTYCFYNCNNVGFTSIPATLFQYSVNAKYFSRTFYGCTKITSIPSGLFQYNTIAETFDYCFYNWIGITTIVAGLFDGLTQIKNLSYCFQNCYELLSIPSDIFADQGASGSVNYTGCFYTASTAAAYNKITGAVPELWNKPNSPVGLQCFFNRTAVSNYASIPAGWK